jgi:hypothetical protein
VFVYALFIEVVAGVCGVLALGAGLYFARSMLNLIYPELLDRPNVLPHRYMAFWDRECLTPEGKEARARSLVFVSIGIGALAVSGVMALQIDRTEALPPPPEAAPASREAAPTDCQDCPVLQVAPPDIN